MRGVDRALGGARGAGGSSAGRRSEPEPCAPAGVEGLLSSPAPCGVGRPGAAWLLWLAVSVRGPNESQFFPPGPS